MRAPVFARWILALTTVGSALALGSLHTMVLAIVAALLGLTSFLVWWHAEPIRARPAATVLMITGMALLAFTALQCVPMPMTWIAVLDPGAADVWSRALSPLHEPGPTWATLSLDPIATRVQFLRGVAYLCAFLTALRVAHKREGVAFLERALVVSVAVMAVAALLHPAFGAQKVFGAYKPVNTVAFAVNHIAPLLNVNHLMGYLNLGVCVALGTALSSKPVFPRLITAVIVLFLVAVALWIGSRGGFLALVLGILLAVALTRASARADRTASVGNLLIGLLALAGVGIGVLTASEDAWNDLSGTDLSKLQLIRQAFGMVRVFPVFGIGRGAFESVFPAFREGNGYWVFTHPENLPAQWIVEWGAPVGILAMAAVAYALRPASVLARSRPPVGAWAAIACVAVQNLVDFSFEVPGIMLAVAVCAAIVVGGSAGTPAPLRVEGWSQRPSALACSIVVAAAGAIALTLPGIPSELNAAQMTLHARAFDPSLSPVDFRRYARVAMLAHPADPYLPFVGALRASRMRDESLIPWIGRGLERSPVFGRAHLLLARNLVVRSPSQARLEFRLAYQQDSTLLGYVSAESVRLIGNFDDAMEIVPAGPSGVPLLEAFTESSIGDRLPATRSLLDAELLARAPDAFDPLSRSAREILADVRAGEAAPWCTGEARRTCIDRGLAMARRVLRKKPSVCVGHALEAELLLEAGETKRALDGLEDAAGHVEDRLSCEQTLVSLAQNAHDDGRVTAALERLTKAGCAVETECAETLMFVAGVEEGRGKTLRALSFYNKVYEQVPERQDALVQAATLASRLGLHAQALQTYVKLAALQPADARWTTAIAAERASISREHSP